MLCLKLHPSLVVESEISFYQIILGKKINGQSHITFINYHIIQIESYEHLLFQLVLCEIFNSLNDQLCIFLLNSKFYWYIRKSFLTLIVPSCTFCKKRLNYCGTIFIVIDDEIGKNTEKHKLFTLKKMSSQ